jgi:hypothetical protein
MTPTPPPAAPRPAEPLTAKMLAGWRIAAEEITVTAETSDEAILANRVVILIDELERLRADAVRLDALERWALAYVETGNCEHIVTLEKFDDEEAPDREFSVTGPRVGRGVWQQGLGVTLRDAIDHALGFDAEFDAASAEDGR